MQISQYKQGLSDLGIKLFDSLREKHKLKEEKDLVMLRIASESWETMLVSREEINDPNFEGEKPHAINKAARGQLMSAMESLWYRMR
jgi:hypothetical protein